MMNAECRMQNDDDTVEAEGDPASAERLQTFVKVLWTDVDGVQFVHELIVPSADCVIHVLWGGDGAWEALCRSGVAVRAPEQNDE